MLKAHIIKKRRDLQVDVTLELEPGSAVGLFGASGAGKSTVLACIAGIEQPDAGFVQLNGQQLFPPSLPLHRRALGYMTQEPGLFPHLSVSENIQFGISKSLAATTQQQQWIATLRDRLQLARCGTHPPRSSPADRRAASLWPACSRASRLSSCSTNLLPGSTASLSAN